MPRRQHTGGTDVSFGEMAAILNMTDEELMILVKNGISHRWKFDDDGVTKIYRFTKEEVLKIVSPLPARREVPVVKTPVIEDEEDEPIETVRPKPRMESTAPPVKAEEKPVEKPAVKTKPKTKPKSTTKK